MIILDWHLSFNSNIAWSTVFLKQANEVKWDLSYDAR